MRFGNFSVTSKKSMKWNGMESEKSNFAFHQFDGLIQNFVDFPTVPLQSIIWLWSKLVFSDSIQFNFMDFWMLQKSSKTHSVL